MTAAAICEQLVGVSPAMCRLRDYIAKVGRSEANVLITGDTGTGKERVAQAVHAASRRARRPLIAINCAAIPDALLESELFGYERGAFTGAQAAYPGKLRLANGGTVFLDEVGEMSVPAQAKLLRVLESREVFPLGGVRVEPLDVRVIAATNQDLEPLMVDRRFRRDLFYRLNVARLSLPPLRERREDIAALFGHYLDFFNRRDGRAVSGPTTELLSCLQAYDWPGNVRELRNLLETIFIDPPTGAVALEDLPEPFRTVFSRYVTSQSNERDQLLATLRATNWNKRRAAEQLRWSRMTLYRKLSKYGLAGERR